MVEYGFLIFILFLFSIRVVRGEPQIEYTRRLRCPIILSEKPGAGVYALVVNNQTSGTTTTCPISWYPPDLTVMDNATACYAQSLMSSIATENVECITLLVRDYLSGTMIRFKAQNSIEFPMTYAARLNAYDSLQYLISLGLDPNIKTTSDRYYAYTPLMWATISNNTKAMEILFRRGTPVCSYPLHIYNLTNVNDRVLEVLGLWKIQHTEPGFYVDGGERCEQLAPCPPGYYCPGYLNRVSQRFPCPMNTYQPLHFMANLKACRPCPNDRRFSAPGTDSLDGCYASDGTDATISSEPEVLQRRPAAISTAELAPHHAKRR